jgi:hypothetical protein
VKRGPVKYACGIDLDDRCAKMCALNLLFLNANAIVVCGNTLTDTLYTAYEITRTPRGGMIREAPGALCREGVQRYLNHALAIPPMFWEAVRDKRYFWQGDTGQTPADRAEAKPESANETPRKAVPLSEIFTPLARIQQGAVIKELAEVGIKRRAWRKSLQQSIGDYDIGHIDAYTVRIRPWFTSAHDFQSYAARLGGAGYEVTPDFAEEGAILVRKLDRSGSTGLDFG